MLKPPRLWDWMTREWCPLPARLAWVLWRALSQAQWSTAVQWREQFLAFDREDRAVSADVVEQASIMAPATPFCFWTKQKYLTVERTMGSWT